ncbi:MAG: hypothetical protein NTW17_02155 [Candidatus Pacearchaeota archaeon]|nr:hypothetical protein [Candidatus Pacearchaeota archaeon]
MEKRGALVILSLFLINFVSAQFGYGSFSITDIFDSFGPENIILMAVFLVLFAVIFYATSRVFKDSYGQPNRAIAGVISFALSVLATYGIYRSGFDISGLFYGFGISGDLLYTSIFVIFVIIMILIIWKLGVGGFFTIFGLFLLLLIFFTDIIYEETIVGIVGGILLLIGLFLLLRRHSGVGRAIMSNRPKYDLQRERRQASSGWLWILLGILVIILGVALGNVIIIILGALLALILVWRKFRRPGAAPGEQFPGQYGYR